MECILNDSVVMVIKEEPMLFQMPAKGMAHALRNGKACYGKEFKDRSCKANVCNCTVCKRTASCGKASREYASMGNAC
jgi:hypothetical protein